MGVIDVTSYSQPKQKNTILNISKRTRQKYVRLYDFIAMTEKEVDPDKCIIGSEKTPIGVTRVYRRCPICHQVVDDVEGSLAGFIAHLSIHKAKIKTK